MTGEPQRPGPVWAALRRSLSASGWLVMSLATGLLALATLALVLLIAVLCLLGVGLLLLRPMLLVLRGLADTERFRLRRIGEPVASPYAELPHHPFAVLRTLRDDPAVRRDLLWLPLHGTYGFTLAAIALQPPANVLHEVSIPLWWSVVPADDSTVLNGLIEITTWTGAWLAFASTPLWLALWLVVTPALLRPQALPGIRLLTPHPDVDLSERVA